MSAIVQSIFPYAQCEHLTILELASLRCLASFICLHHSHARVIADGPGGARIVLDAPDDGSGSGSGGDSSDEEKEGAASRPWSWVANGEQPRKKTVIADAEQSTESSGPDDDAVVEISPNHYGTGAAHGAVEHGNEDSTDSEPANEDLWQPKETKRLFRRR